MRLGKLQLECPYHFVYLFGQICPSVHLRSPFGDICQSDTCHGTFWSLGHVLQFFMSSILASSCSQSHFWLDFGWEFQWLEISINSPTMMMLMFTGYFWNVHPFPGNDDTHKYACIVEISINSLAMIAHMITGALLKFPSIPWQWWRVCLQVYCDDAHVIEFPICSLSMMLHMFTGVID